MTEQNFDSKTKQFAAEIDYRATLIRTAGNEAASTVIKPRLNSLDAADLRHIVAIQLVALANLQKQALEVQKDLLELAAEIERENA